MNRWQKGTVTGAVTAKADDLISFEFVRVDCAIGVHKLHERQVEEIKKFFGLFPSQ